LAGQPLPEDLRVQVVGVAGNGVDGVWVRFVTSDGIVVPESVQTAAGGVAQGTWTLPLVTGQYTATASVPDLAPATFSATVQDQAISETTQSIGSSGGTLNVSGAEGQASVQLAIPAGVLPPGSNVSLGLQPVPSGTLPAGRFPLAPVVAVSGPYMRSDSIITVRIPVAGAQGTTPAPFEIDDATLRPVLVLSSDSNSITIGIRTLALPPPASPARGARTGTGTSRQYVVTYAESSSSSDIIDTGFRPGIDDWEFANAGSALEPDGHCIGQSLSMIWYYIERRIGQQRQTLNGAFSRASGFPHEYDNRAFRLASVVQHDLGLERGFRERLNQWLLPDEITWILLVDVLSMTGRPTELSVREAGLLGAAHSLVVWRVERSTGTVWIADPNKPGDTNRTIHYESSSKHFDSYVGSERADGTPRIYPNIYLTPLDRADWDAIGSRWQEFDAGTIGAGLFPSAPVSYQPWGTHISPSQIVGDHLVVTDTAEAFQLSTPDGYVVAVRNRDGAGKGVDQYVNLDHEAPIEIFDLLTWVRPASPDDPLRFVDALELTVKAMPAIGTISPSAGPPAGGTSVRIRGVNFFSVTRVTIGGNPLGNLRVVNSTEITGTTPASSTAGPKDIVLTTNTESTTCTGCFTYTAWKSLLTTTRNTCGVSSTDTAYCWGWNFNGQVGDSTRVDRWTPTPVSGGHTYNALSVGGYTVCGLTDSGVGYCWGYNPPYQGSWTAPTRVFNGLQIKILASAGNYVCALTVAGTAYCWGHNDYGELGIGTTEDQLTPVQVLGAVAFESLFTGSIHACGLAVGGEAYCWGDNIFGQLGDGTVMQRLVPTSVAGGNRFATLSLGGGRLTCGLDLNADWYCWGSVDLSSFYSTTPRLVANGSFVMIAVGQRHACALDDEGVASCWGYNSDGQLGDGSTTNRSNPVAVAGGLRFASLSAGNGHTCGVTTDGLGYCWGRNDYGQFGTGTTQGSPTPVRVSSPVPPPVPGDLSQHQIPTFRQR
jgi:alpha-tubulin suppressor-like RCC1 family protein